MSYSRTLEEVAIVERWERRERKLTKRRQGMQVHGVGLKKVVLPILRRKAEEADRAVAKRRRPMALLALPRPGSPRSGHKLSQ